VYHVLNRAVGRRRLFRKDEDYMAFVRTLAEGVERFDMRLLAFCLMPNHWHLVLHPRTDGGTSQFVRWITATHSNRYHAHYGTAGEGHLYQGRFKSFPVQDDRHYLIVCRYVERNALRCGLVKRAENWRWGSARLRGAHEKGWPALASGPLDLPHDWSRLLNEPQTPAEEEAMRQSVRRGLPFGDAQWQLRTAKRLAISLRRRGRPFNKGSRHL
jgi:putative transposase